MPQLFNLGGLQVQSLNELRINKLMSEDAANTFFEYDSANTKFEMNLDQITNNHLPVYACRAWVNFNGTLDENGNSLSTGENVLIRESGNISSVTYNGTGNYTVNFGDEMPDENYSAFINAVATLSGRTASASPYYTGTYSASAVRIFVKDTADNSINSSKVNVSIFR